MTTVSPVMNAASSEARKANRAAASSGLPRRRSGSVSAYAAMTSALSMLAARGVTM